MASTARIGKLGLRIRGLQTVVTVVHKITGLHERTGQGVKAAITKFGT
jgi:hypothetical protein